MVLADNKRMLLGMIVAVMSILALDTVARSPFQAETCFLQERHGISPLSRISWRAAAVDLAAWRAWLGWM